MRIVAFLLLLVAGAVSQTPPIEPGVSHELAKWRAVQYSNIRYKLNLTLEKMSPVLRGSMEIHVTQAATACAEPNCPPMAIILDWRKILGHEKDSTISNVSINGTALRVPPSLTVGPAQPDDAQARTLVRAVPGTWTYEESNDHLIFRVGVRMGENVIKLDFTSQILTSGSAITRYVDKEDGAEYIYSLFVPSDASTAFPVFDQPDLKARFTLSVLTSRDWSVVSNTFPDPPVRVKAFEEPYREEGVNKVRQGVSWTLFSETKPISTYVFAFAAGPFEEFTDAGGEGGNPSGSEGAQRSTSSDASTLPTGRVSASTADKSRHIYVRKSQAAKFKPHAAEVFRLTRDGIKYLETYFDYKFPFPKYDLVLIPEFPFGGMEHAGATFLRESSVIFPTEPTKSDQISRANLIFHETAHQWFGDTVTMRWFDDLWLKEGFAEFMAYKTLEKVMPEANAWKVFYERNKQAAYLTDSTKGTTPIYQPIANLSAAKSAYGNIVYRKAPSFLRQAEFYLGEDKFQTAVRAFLKKHEYANAGWEDLVKEFEAAGRLDLKTWANIWVRLSGTPILRVTRVVDRCIETTAVRETDGLGDEAVWPMDVNALTLLGGKSIPHAITKRVNLGSPRTLLDSRNICNALEMPLATFPNYQDYGYGIFLLDDKSRDYVLKNIQNEKDPFLRSMMWGALWDSVREAELDPKVYVDLAIKNLPTEQDETIVSSILGRVSTAMNYYMSDAGLMQKPAREQGLNAQRPSQALPNGRASATDALRARLEALLLDRLQHAPTAGQRITFYRAFVNNASTPASREVLKAMLRQGGNPSSSEGALRGGAQTGTLPTGRVSASSASIPLRSKDKFDIATRLIILGDPDAPGLLAGLEKTETGDDAKRYAYAAKAGDATAENKAKFWNDFVSNKDISESWIEAAIGPFNSVRHAALTQQYLERALIELPNLKRTRKIFFINNWLGAWIGGQRDEQALAIVHKFLADNPKLDNDLRLKILENVDLIERAVKIRSKYGKS